MFKLGLVLVEPSDHKSGDKRHDLLLQCTNKIFQYIYLRIVLILETGLLTNSSIYTSHVGR